MHVFTLLLTIAASVLAAEVEITTTHAVTCDRKTRVGDTISVNYRGTLPTVAGHDPEVFDSSYDHHPPAPIEFRLGKGEVITGWDKGLMDMCIGEKRNLVIPPSLAYGSHRAIGSCATDCTLLFETELVAIKGVDPQAPPKKEPEKEPVKEADKVSGRQNSIDHVMLIFAGALISVSVLMVYFCVRRGKGGGKYEVIKLQNV